MASNPVYAKNSNIAVAANAPDTPPSESSTKSGTNGVKFVPLMANNPMTMNANKGTNLDTVIKLFRILVILTPIILITVNKTMMIVAMTSFIKSPDSAGIAAPKAVANPTAITAQAMSTTIHLRTPTSNPQKSPKECFAYK